jgi:hypothetical protein
MTGFRDFRRQVQQLLAAAGFNPRGVSDGALIEAWLAEEHAADFAARFMLEALETERAFV